MNHIKAQKYVNAILKLVEGDSYKTSDILSIVTRIAMDESLLTFEERLTRSKAQDLQ